LLAAELPSIDAGTWKVFDDGRMEVTWRLNRGVLWHDGTEFTSADVRFGWQAAADPVALGRSSLTVRQMEDVTTPDPYTVVVHWRETSRFGAEMGRNQWTPLPRHILETALLSDPGTFAANPYFSDPDALVGNGAYRLLTWERGSHATAEAFDRYYLGRPKIDRDGRRATAGWCRMPQPTTATSSSRCARRWRCRGTSSTCRCAAR
jgi:peptide/nickel transport system substrate-binding protein